MGPIVRSNLSSKVYLQLRQLILEHQIKPGQRIGLAEMAKTLDVSLTPVREALTRLHHEQFVIHHPNRGHFVAQITPAEACDLFGVREAIEIAALKVGVPRADEQQLRLLGEAVASYSRAIHHAEPDRFREDKRLHLSFTALAGNRLLSQLAEQTLDTIIMKLNIESLPRQRGPAADAEHRAILDAVTRRAADEACEHLRKHLATTREYVLTFLAEHPEVGREDQGSTRQILSPGRYTSAPLQDTARSPVGNR
jgi:DNA-binding GntR family transcriptional regulator